MTNKEFTIEINAKPEYVWYALWDKSHYQDWTSVFCQGSYAISDWKEGSGIHFLAPNGSGMYSKITRNAPFEKMYFTHVGLLKNYEEQAIDEETKAWTGCTENYELIEKNGQTTLKVNLELDEKHAEYFEKTFPAGLEKVKQNAEKMIIHIEETIEAPIEKVWNYFTQSDHITKWNHASDDWHTTKAEVDLQDGGKFFFRMEAKDGSFGFDFIGLYDNIIDKELVSYTLQDNRNVIIEFIDEGKHVKVKQAFNPENENALEMQKFGWQMILTNFKKYVESN